MVKFGVKTDTAKPGINWKAVDRNDNEIDIGRTLVTEGQAIEPGNDVSEISATGEGILQESVFRLIPEKPNIGSTIRIAGERFGPNEELDFYIADRKITSFQTDSSGKFMVTSKVPENLQSERVDFMLKDSMDNEKRISLRLGEDDARKSVEAVSLSISGIPPVVHRGEFVTVTGTGQPGGTVTATIKDEDKVVTTIAVPIATNGKWEFQTVVPADARLGEHTAQISDGKETIVRTWKIESSKIIDLEPTKQMFEPGETVVINGTAIPEKQLEILVEDPQGTEFYTEFLDIDSSGKVNFEFPTHQSSPEGTYVVFATQEGVTEIVVLGIGQIPAQPLIVKMDKLNYGAGETAIIELQGPTSSQVSILILDPADKEKFENSTSLGPDGRAQYELPLVGFASGAYTTVIRQGPTITSEVFSVGLQTGSGPVEQLGTTKDEYQPGESILVLGKTGKSVLLTLTLINPDGEEVRKKETFTNKDGIFSEDSFRVPLDALQGVWTINAKSGPNFANTKFTVLKDKSEGMVVLVDSILPSPAGKQVNIKGYGAGPTQTIVLLVYNEEGEEVDELTIFSTKSGEFSTIWLAGPDNEPGTYTILANDADEETSTTFILK